MSYKKNALPIPPNIPMSKTPMPVELELIEYNKRKKIIMNGKLDKIKCFKPILEESHAAGKPMIA